MNEILTLEQILEIGIKTLPVGFIIGCFPMLIGYVIEAMFNIFKRL